MAFVPAREAPPVAQSASAAAATTPSGSSALQDGLLNGSSESPTRGVERTGDRRSCGKLGPGSERLPERFGGVLRLAAHEDDEDDEGQRRRAGRRGRTGSTSTPCTCSDGAEGDRGAEEVGAGHDAERLPGARRSRARRRRSRGRRSCPPTTTARWRSRAGRRRCRRARHRATTATKRTVEGETPYARSASGRSPAVRISRPQRLRKRSHHVPAATNHET